METDIDKCSVERKCFEIKEKELLLENERLLEHILYQDVICIAMWKRIFEKRTKNEAKNDKIEHGMEKRGQFIDLLVFELKQQDMDVNSMEVISYSHNIEDITAKSVSDCAIQVNNSNVIASGMYKLDLPPLSLKLKRNRKAHVDYLMKAKEHADTLCDIVEQAKALQPLDSAQDYACKFTTRIHELLVYVDATYPSSPTKNEKSVAKAKVNKSKKVRFEEPRRSTSDTPNQADSRNSKITKPPLLNSTGVKITTSGNDHSL
ncbi:hypothetical protein Tco_1531937 [Tanacetum coccineum]